MIDNLTRAQQFMLTACLASNKYDREKAVRLWEQEVVMDDLDFSSFRLIPYFYNSYQQDGIACAHDKRIKVIYKHWWLRTQHISHELTILHAAFVEAGIDVVVIKGASIRSHYEQNVLRPMADFDLLIHRSNIDQALLVIENLNYKSNKNLHTNLKRRPSVFFDFVHAITCEHVGNGSQLDLHWRAGYWYSTAFTEALWRNTEPYKEIQNGKRPRLSYELFMIVVHAVESQNRDNLNWIIDVAIINKKADESVWKEARDIAVQEQKEGLFDYGCSLLRQFGLYAIEGGLAVRPRGILPTAPEQRVKMNFIELISTRVGNMMYGVNLRFPHMNRVQKIGKVIKTIYYRFVLKYYV